MRIFQVVAIDIPIDLILFTFGKLCLSLVTFGNYPKDEVTTKEFVNISIIGLLTIIAIWAAVDWYDDYLASALAS